MSVRQHQAVVVGSALHAHQWQPEAGSFLREYSKELRRVPVWLFSICEPCGNARGDAPMTHAREESAAVVEARGVLSIHDHRHFASEIAPTARNQWWDLFFKVCGGAARDDRAFFELNEWADGIAREVQAMDHAKERRRLHLSVRGRP